MWYDDSETPAVCKKCAVGYYQPKAGQKKCLECPDKATANGEPGATTKEQCHSMDLTCKLHKIAAE